MGVGFVGSVNEFGGAHAPYFEYSYIWPRVGIGGREGHVLILVGV